MMLEHQADVIVIIVAGDAWRYASPSGRVWISS
jgi:hypothetical protein